MTDKPPRYDLHGPVSPQTEAARDQVNEYAVQQIRSGVNYLLILAPDDDEDVQIVTCLRMAPPHVSHFYLSVIEMILDEALAYDQRRRDER